MILESKQQAKFPSSFLAELPRIDSVKLQKKLHIACEKLEIVKKELEWTQSRLRDIEGSTKEANQVLPKVLKEI